MRIVNTKLNPYIRQQRVRNPYVAGDVCGRKRLIDLLAAAIENETFEPQLKQVFAVEPTRFPQFGQIRGRPTGGSVRFE
jgi:hypothetical protein